MNLRSSEPLDQVNLRLSGILRLSEPLGSEHLLPIHILSKISGKFSMEK